MEDSLPSRSEVGRVEQHWYLKSCRILERLPPDELSQLEAKSRFRKFATGDVVYLPLDRADAVLAADGKQSILAFIDPGEVFGELCLFDTESREEQAIAMVPTAIVLIPRDLIQQLISRHAELALGITRRMGLRRLRIERRLKSLLFRSNRERLLQLWMELATEYGTPSKLGIEIRIKLSHQDLASIIGSTRETVTMTLGELQEQGVVALGRQRLTICSMERLGNMVD
jgi:CRP/FNR family cyclic AMP-dependent transcriptional regulator